MYEESRGNEGCERRGDEEKAMKKFKMHASVGCERQIREKMRWAIARLRGVKREWVKRSRG